MVTLTVPVLPSARLIVSVKLAPEEQRSLFRSEENTLKFPPSATGRLTLPLEPLRSAASNELAVPKTQLIACQIVRREAGDDPAGISYAFPSESFYSTRP